MSYGGAYPHIKCIAPGGTTKDMVLQAIYEQNATCTICGDPFDNDDVCFWDGKRRVEHVDCRSPQEPSDALKRGAEEKAVRATAK
jgi:hypothetical protein